MTYSSGLTPSIIHSFVHRCQEGPTHLASVLRSPFPSTGSRRQETGHFLAQKKNLGGVAKKGGRGAADGSVALLEREQTAWTEENVGQTGQLRVGMCAVVRIHTSGWGWGKEGEGLNEHYADARPAKSLSQTTPSP